MKRGRTGKRIAALFLSLVLIAGTQPAQVMAESSGEVAETPAYAAPDNTELSDHADEGLLNALSVSGEDAELLFPEPAPAEPESTAFDSAENTPPESEGEQSSLPETDSRLDEVAITVKAADTDTAPASAGDPQAASTEEPVETEAAAAADTDSIPSSAVDLQAAAVGEVAITVKTMDADNAPAASAEEPVETEAAAAADTDSIPASAGDLQAASAEETVAIEEAAAADTYIAPASAVDPQAASAEETVAVEEAAVADADSIPASAGDPQAATAEETVEVEEAAVTGSTDNGGMATPDAFQGNGTEASPWEIRSVGDLQMLADSVNAGNAQSGKYFRLMADISINDHCADSINKGNGGWTPIGAAGDIPFDGVFDGDHKTISGLMISSSMNCRGLFGTVTGTVKDLTVKGNVTGGSFVGGIAGLNYGVISDCHFLGTKSAVTGTSYVGGIAGVCGPGGRIENCSSEALVIGYDVGVGGIAGWVNGIPEAANVGDAIGTVEDEETKKIRLAHAYGAAQGESEVKNCGFSGRVEYQGLSQAGDAYKGQGGISFAIANDLYGGIAGVCTGGRLTDCTNTGSILGDICTGGVVGFMSYSTGSRLVNSGKVQGGLLTGGIAGWIQASTLTDCRNNGKVTAEVSNDEDNKIGDFTGGVVGYTDADCSVTGLQNTGTVTGARNYTGGIIGYAKCPAEGFKNSGEVSGLVGVGGILGYGERDVTGCENTGKVTGTVYVGGIAGQSDGSVAVCVNGSNSSVTSEIKENKVPGRVGGIAGEAGQVMDCANYGAVKATCDGVYNGIGDYMGGVAGLVAGNVSGCTNSGSVKGTLLYIGGIAGKAGGSVTDCGNTGAIGGSGYAGGIAGVSGGVVRGCDNNGNVKSVDYGRNDGGGNFVAGIAGEAKKGASACRNTGNVDTSGQGDYVAGIVGQTDGAVTGCTNSGSVYGKNTVGGIVGKATAAVRSCENKKGSSVKGEKTGIGGIVGMIKSAGITDCQNAGTVSGGEMCVGGIAGACEDATIDGCFVTKDAGVRAAEAQQVGGIVGTCQGSGGVRNCKNSAAVSGGSCIGGVAGVCSGTTVVASCVMAGSVTGSGGRIGGIAGSIGVNGGNEQENGTHAGIECCVSSGTVQGQGDTGGIAGACIHGGRITACTSRTEVTGWGTGTGGIVGSILEGAALEGCTNTGAVHGGGEATGGIAGLSGAGLENCVNEGPVSGTGRRTGGIVGGATGPVSFCTNLASVTSGSIDTGGIVGIGTTIDISSCVNGPEATVTGGTKAGDSQQATASGTGGIAGKLCEKCNVTDCINYAAVKPDNDGASCAYVGGIAGLDTRGTFKNCRNEGAVTGDGAGGILGGANGSSVESCENRQTVTAVTAAGGIVGTAVVAGRRSSVRECKNSAPVKGFNTGGILGSGDVDIERCTNSGAVAQSETVTEKGGGTGGIIGNLTAGSVSLCENSGEIGRTLAGGFSVGEYVGGIVGGTTGGSIKKCRNLGSVQGLNMVGGIVGLLRNKGHKVSECVNRGMVLSEGTQVMVADERRVEGGMDIGGIVGLAQNGVTIENCYNTGEVYGVMMVGGIVGTADGAPLTVTLNKNYCKAPKTSSLLKDYYGVDTWKAHTEDAALARCGGLIGYDHNVSMSHNYWWSKCARLALGTEGDSAVLFPHDGDDYGFYGVESRFADRNNFTGWDFDSVWEIRDSIPVLRFENAAGKKGLSGIAGASVDPDMVGGGGNYYYGEMSGAVRIETVRDLKAFRDAVNSDRESTRNSVRGQTVLLCADLDLSGEVWTPIGTFPDNDPNNVDNVLAGRVRPFSGTFDGQGHRITGLQVDCGSLPAGLFGYTNDATVKNLAVEGTVNGTGRYVGGIVGCSDLTSRIESCSFTGDVHGSGVKIADGYGNVSDYYVGGIAGAHFSDVDGSLINCWHAGSVTVDGYGYAAGIAGTAGTMHGCFHYDGEIRGGRVAQMDYDEAVFIRSGNSSSGGLVGYVRSLFGVSNPIRYNYCLSGAADGHLDGYNPHGWNTNVAVSRTLNRFLSKEQFADKVNFTGEWSDEGLDFTSVWGMGAEHPLLQMCSDAVYLDPNGVAVDVAVAWIEKRGGRLITNPFTRKGYVFTGWNTGKAGDGTGCADGAEVKGSQTLYAMWGRDPAADMTISFYGNGGEGGMKSVTAAGGTSVTLPAGTFTRTGFDLAGWNTRADGKGTAYADRASMTVQDDTRLYAQWAAKPFVIRFTGEDNTQLSEQTVLSGKLPVYSGLMPTKVPSEGKLWIFAGWTPRMGLVTGETTYSAVFQETKAAGQPWSVTIVGGTGPDSAKPGETVAIKADAPAHGQEFDRWASDEVMMKEATQAEATFTMPTQDVTLTATYKAGSWDIIYDTDGGELGRNAPTRYTYGEGMTLTDEVTKEGFAFAGWYDAAGEQVTQIGSTETGEKSFTAHWTKLPGRLMLVAGAGMTLQSGDEKQADVTEDIHPVVYTASTAYYFPEDYGLEEKGITVTRDSLTQITVTGSPIGDVMIRLPGATAKQAEDVSGVDFQATDESRGLLTGLEDGAQYVLNFNPFGEPEQEPVDNVIGYIAECDFDWNPTEPIALHELCLDDNGELYTRINGVIRKVELVSSGDLEQPSVTPQYYIVISLDEPVVKIPAISWLQNADPDSLPSDGESFMEPDAGSDSEGIPIFEAPEDGSATMDATSLSPMSFTAAGTTQELTGVVPGVLTVTRIAGGETTLDSEAKSFTITQADAVDGLDRTDCTADGQNDGSILHVNRTMEYRLKSSEETAWIDVTGAEITGLAPGTWQIRSRPSGTMLASGTAEITIKAYNAPGQVMAPVFSVPGGRYRDGQTVSITCGTEDAAIYYTTDGTLPTPESTLYREPITVSDNLRIRAVAVKDGMTDSAIVEGTWYIGAFYEVTVENGTSDVSFAQMGQTVTIKADPAPEGQIFIKWVSEDEDVIFDDETGTETTFVMPKKNVTVRAIFQFYKEMLMEPVDPEQAAEKIRADFRYIGLHTASVDFTMDGTWSVDSIVVLPAGAKAPTGDTAENAHTVDWTDDKGDLTQAAAMGKGSIRLGEKDLPKNGTAYDVYAKVYAVDIPVVLAMFGDPTIIGELPYAWLKLGTVTTVYGYGIVDYRLKAGTAAEIPFYSRKPVADYFRTPKLAVIGGDGYGGAGKTFTGDPREDYFAADFNGISWQVVSADGKTVLMDIDGSVSQGDAAYGGFFGGDTAKGLPWVGSTVNVTAGFGLKSKKGAGIDEATYEAAGFRVSESIPVKIMNTKLMISALDARLTGADHKLVSGTLSYTFTDLDDILAPAAASGIVPKQGITVSDACLGYFAIGESAAAPGRVFAPGHHTLTIRSDTLEEFAGQDETLKKITAAEGYELVINPTPADFYVVPSLQDTLEVSLAGAATVPYGERGGAGVTDNNDSLNDLFALTVTADGKELPLQDLEVEYRFSDSKDQEWSGMTKILQSFKVGDTPFVTVHIRIPDAADTLEKTADASFTVVRRRVRLTLDRLVADEVLQPDSEEDDNLPCKKAGDYPGFYRNAENTEVLINNRANRDAVTMTALDRYGKVAGAAMFDSALSIKSGILKSDAELVLDSGTVEKKLSGVYPVRFSSYKTTDDFNVNFEVYDTAAKIRVYARNRAVFKARYNGTIKSEVFDITADTGRSLASGSHGSDMKKLYDDRSFGGFLKTENGIVCEVSGYRITATGEDGVGRELRTGDGREYMLESFDDSYEKLAEAIGGITFEENTDYQFEAVTEITLERGLMRAVSIGNVTYDGRYHLVEQNLANKNLKTKVDDIRLELQGAVLNEDGTWGMRDLVYGSDFTISYKNNKEASVRYENGELVQLNPKKRPTAVVTGKGNFKGLKLTLYFDILPAPLDSLGETEGRKLLDGASGSGLRVEGLAHSMEAGWMGKEVKLKYRALYDSYATTKTVKLQKKDYRELVWRYDEDLREWVKSTPSAGGDYMLALEGTGNYCGILYLEDKPGKRSLEEEYSDPSTGFFHLESGRTLLLERAGIKCTKKADHPGNGKYLVASSFVKTVKCGKTVLDPADYRVRALRADGVTVVDDFDADYPPDDQDTTGLTQRIGGEFFGKDAGDYYLEILPRADQNGSVKVYGSKKIKFTVSPAKLNKKKFSLQRLDGTSVTGISNRKLAYSGRKEILRIVSDTYREGVDYEILDEGGVLNIRDEESGRYLPGNNLLPGTYKITIRGKGAYSKTVDITFTRTGATFKNVAADPTFMKITVEPVQFNVNGSYPAVRIQLYDQNTGKLDDGYTLEMSVGADGYSHDGDRIMHLPDNAAANNLIKTGKVSGVNFGNDRTGQQLVLDLKFSNHLKAGKGKLTLSASQEYTSVVKGNYTMTYDIGKTEIKATSMGGTSYFDAQGSYEPGKFYVNAQDLPVNAKGYGSAVSKFTVYQADCFGLSAKAIKAQEYTLTVNGTPTETGENRVMLSAGSKATNFAVSDSVDTNADFRIYQSSKIKYYTFKQDPEAQSLEYLIPGGGKELLDRTKATPVAVYTGAPIRPDLSQLTVNLDGKDTLLKLSDGAYEVCYGSNTGVGNGEIIVRLRCAGANRSADGRMLYGGIRTFKFKIVPDGSMKVSL